MQAVGRQAGSGRLARVADRPCPGRLASSRDWHRDISALSRLTRGRATGRSRCAPPLPVELHRHRVSKHVCSHMCRREARAIDPMLTEPARKVLDLSGRFLHRSRGVPLIPLLLNKSLNVRQKRALLRLSAWVHECLSHDHLQSRHGAWLVMKLSRVKIRQLPLDATRRSKRLGIFLDSE